MTARTQQKRRKKPQMGRVSVADRRQIDGRSAPVRAQMQLRSELLKALGGDGVSPQKILLIDRITAHAQNLREIDAYLLQVGCVNRRRRSAWPLVAQREAMAANLLRMLTALGLERLEVTPDLQSFLRAHSGNASDAQTPAESLDGQEIEPGAEIEPDGEEDDE